MHNNRYTIKKSPPIIGLVFLLLVTSLLPAQTYTTEVTIVNGGAGRMTGFLAPAIQGEDRQSGSMTVLVGQPFVSTGVMSGGGLKTELGFWTARLRKPGTPELTASYDIFPDKVNLDWSYDPNISPATKQHNIYRDNVLIYDNYPIDKSDYSDESNDLNVGTEYRYKLVGKNVFGLSPIPAETIGKTSTSGFISGNITSKQGTKIPNVKLVLTPNWGYSLFFDGAEDYMTIPDADEFELTDDGLMPDATLEFWVRPLTVANQVLISKGALWNLNLKDVGGYLKLAFTFNSTQKFQTDNSINTNAWTHIAIVKTEGSISVFLNGELATINGGQSVVVIGGSGSNADILTFGKDASGNYFRGNIDDFRMWDIARTTAEIARDYNRYLYYRTGETINYPHITINMNFDFGSGSTVTNVVDQDYNGTLYGVSADTWSETKSLAYATAYTDANGYYAMPNINYGGSGTLFRLTPTKPYHEFNVNFLDISLNENNPTALNQNFTVENLMSITGYVYFKTENTNGVQCGEEGVQIKVNGDIRTNTNADGFYRVEVEPGADVVILPERNSRVITDFDPYQLSFTNVVTDKTANFIDKKTRNLRGSVTGGSCGYPLGPYGIATVELKPASNKFIKTVTADAAGNFVFPNLPPQAYQISVTINIGYDSWTQAMSDFFKGAGKTINTENSYSIADSAWIGEDDTLDFVYRSPVLARIDGFKRHIIWNPVTQNNITNNYFNQNQPDSLEFFVYEQYYNGAECPVDSGVFQIFDNISDRWSESSEDTVEVSFGHDGNYRYGVMPGKPNISDAGSRPYHKKIEIRAKDMLGRTAPAVEYAVVLGNVPQQMDFTTVAPDIPYLILRRPPGDQSFAEFSSSQTQSTEFQIDVGMALGQEREVKASLGTKFTTVVGFGVSTELSVEAKYEMTAGLSSTFSLSSSNSQQISVTTQSTYQTGTGVDVAGNHGDLDLFVGGALNLLYGKTYVFSIQQDADKYIYKLDTEIMFVPDGFATTFIYTRKYIEEILLPELAMLSEADSTKLEDISRWNQVLAREDSLRWLTQDTVNYSFEGGAGAYSQSRTSEVTDSHTLNVGLDINASFAKEIGFEINEGFGLSTSTKYNFGFKMGRSSTSTQTVSNSSSFSLDDDDFGDDYSVSVGSDPVYGTPVFHVIAGHSSCPYEEWMNELGEVVTIPRDVPYMEWDGLSVMDNVLSTDPAEFSVLLRNDNDEGRTYFLSLVQSSNPNGALIEINGQIYVEPIPYMLDSLDGEYAQIRVWRGPGDHYEYPNLRVKFAPECESNYAGVTTGFTLPFTVNFARPCTEAEVYEPGNNWVLNIANQDTLDIVATGYDLNQSYFEALHLQYRALGGDQWYTIDDATLNADTLRTYNQVASVMRWPLPDGFTDGIYDIRLRSMCLDSLLTNEMPALRGTIDRQKPKTLGAPEPVDEVLNMNDEIAINFTEKINPATVSGSNVILFDGQAGGRITDLEVTVSEERLVITPQIQNRFIENHFMTATLFDYQDMYGNPGDTITWDFQVNRNPISWNVPTINLIAFIGDDNNFETTLNNIGANARQFELIDLPEWLIPSTTIGEINPGGSFKIQFQIDENLNVGEYENVIYAETPDGLEPLRINLVNMCPYPYWSVVPNDFQYSMNVTARLFVKGTKSEDKYDRIGAFINGECRGLANVVHNENLDEYLAHLTIYSNQFSGEIVEFHIWDRTECVEYWGLDTTLIFVENAIAGTPTNPLELNANGARAQEIEMRKGFSWFSLNLESTDANNLNKVFEDFRVADGDRIISQTAYAQYSGTGKTWTGPLAETGLELGKMYICDVDTANDLDYIGFKIWPDTVDIFLNSGWNWLGYLPNERINVNEALYSMSNTPDDLIKDQFGYAQFVETYGWIGSLQWMIPGRGYKINIASKDTLTYPSDENKSLGSLFLAKTDSRSETQLPEISWEADAYKYANSMTITGLIDSDTLGINDPADVVIAKVAKEIRGVARPVYVPQLDAYRVFLMIYGDQTEAVEFDIYDQDKDILYHSNEFVSFEVNLAKGNPNDPMIFTKAPLRPGDKGYIPEIYSLSQNFPNP
ncbi:hypothetical protein KKC74_13620, partial [bacterium]|nr:hypothetical protein [bacterium]